MNIRRKTGVAHTELAAVLGRRIKERRDELGWDQEVLAAQVGVVRSVVSNWEHGKRTPGDLATLVALGRALGVSLDWLTGRSEDKFPADAYRATFGGLEELTDKLLEHLQRKL
jgi:transcriptional regulator with XRE-family HTH domain